MIGMKLRRKRISSSELMENKEGMVRRIIKRKGNC
jgi:hypothetical protein